MRTSFVLGVGFSLPAVLTAEPVTVVNTNTSIAPLVVLTAGGTPSCQYTLAGQVGVNAPVPCVCTSVNDHAPPVGGLMNV